MALNQTQRDHAIKMIQAAVQEKRKNICINALDISDFIEAHINRTNLTSITIEQLRKAMRGGSWTGYSINMLAAFDLQDAYALHKRDVAQTNAKLCENLNALETRLIGEVMFGNDYSIITAALESIANY